MIELKGLSKSFNNHVVLNNVTTTFKDGSIYGLIGINGAGKSTLLRLISGILRSDEGDILIDNLSVYANEGIKRNVFYLSDQLHHAGALTLDDLMALYRVFYPFDEALYKHILGIFDLCPTSRLSTLSKGMKRQGMIAIAFASKAKYLLLDEVFDGLDPAARLKFKKLMIELQTEDRIIILTSHALRELEDICDTFGMLDHASLKTYDDLERHLSTIQKYQIVLNHKDPVTLNPKEFPHFFFEQNGRVIHLICNSDLMIHDAIDARFCLAVDKQPITFEEYFILTQEVKETCETTSTI